MNSIGKINILKSSSVTVALPVIYCTEPYLEDLNPNFRPLCYFDMLSFIIIQKFKKRYSNYRIFIFNSK